MRKTAILAATAIATLALPAFSQVGFIEEGTYRSGGTYASYQSDSAEQCSDLCAGEASCGSWSFMRHGSSRPASRCELKIGIGRAESDPNASSGISPRHEQRYYKPLPEPVVLPTSDELAGGASTSRTTRTTRTTRVVPRTSRPATDAATGRPTLMATVPGSTVYETPELPMVDEDGFYPGGPLDFNAGDEDGTGDGYRDGAGEVRIAPPPTVRNAQEPPRGSINRQE